jgi:hypothetical protein
MAMYQNSMWNENVFNSYLGSGGGSGLNFQLPGLFAGSFDIPGSNAYIVTSSQYGPYHYWGYFLNINNNGIARDYRDKTWAASVRCLKNYLSKEYYLIIFL